MISIVEIRYSKKALKYLLKLQPKLRDRIRNTIRKIADGNTQGLNIVAMQDVDAFRVRIGDYRVIYEINDDELVLIVIKIGARGDVYK
ncbi:MAG: type II toxin-antitoxin system RelE/ParE family toxin [Gammaproteobacteria bacterium]|nr:MAG: type II toxin-antitoxin system RelE/ParE family toxin [Gammaproteobacteria bacterium]